MLCGNLILVLHYILKNYLHRKCVLQKTNYHTSSSRGRLILVLYAYLSSLHRHPIKSDLLVGKRLKVVGLESSIFFGLFMLNFCNLQQSDYQSILSRTFLKGMPSSSMILLRGIFPDNHTLYHVQLFRYCEWLAFCVPC